MTHQTSCAAFHRGKDLAIVSLNGVLNVWDVDSGTKKNEYTPASHLTSSFTCLSWKIHKSIATKKRSRTTRRSVAVRDADSEKIIAVGTATGEIYLYDVKIGELIGKLDGEHTDKVNCVCWDPSDQTLVSCSEDQHIVHWDVSSYKAICKWRGDRRGVSSVCIGPHSTLLSAGKRIKLWDLKTQALLQTFTGHASSIISLSCVDLFPKTPSKRAKTLSLVEGLYFLSAASEDRIVNVWQVQSDNKKIASVNFSLESEPVSMVVKSPPSTEKPTYLVVLTEDGEVNIFSHTLDGQMKKPLEVQMVVTVVDPSAKKLKILSASFVENADSETAAILIAYGTNVKIVFERVNLDDHDTQRVVLIRNDPMKIEVEMDGITTKTRQPIRIKNEITTLEPGVKGHSFNGTEEISTKDSMTEEISTTDRSKRRKLADTDTSLVETEMTMEERVNALSLRRDSETERLQPLKADSLSVLLSQGLQSNDKEILNRVLQNTSLSLIRNTVQRLPISLVVSLIRDLTGRMQTTPDTARKFVLWLRETLKIHSSYLMTLPDLVPVLSHLYQVVDARTKAHERFIKLEGKLELLASQISLKKAASETKGIDTTPLVLFEDESSDEQEDVLLDDLPEDNSDLSDMNDWDEPEEMEMETKMQEAFDDDETDSGVANGAMEED